MRMGKGDINRQYAVHGDDLESVREGFRVLGMPEHRRAEAFQIVDEVLAANQVVDFRWYKTDGHNELACYWDDQPANTLWVTASKVHIPSDTASVTRPERPTDWQKEGQEEAGAYVGWLLPGAERGTGGGPRESEIATVLCPETYIRQPARTICPTCEVVHYS